MSNFASCADELQCTQSHLLCSLLYGLPAKVRVCDEHEAEESACNSAVHFPALRLRDCSCESTVKLNENTNPDVDVDAPGPPVPEVAVGITPCTTASIIKDYFPLLRTSDNNIDFSLYLDSSRVDQAARATINGLRRTLPLQSINHTELNALLHEQTYT
ncbi:hypothetical protein VPNG_03542 [Cytospora leucostoma]|uniref:PD-(D/E)XK nuclease-like domain-containing protein n=1 Tax=Cytospora leucostoma TaxID=1230097 RepID=A0A423XCW8_9PEZI|nr:hypothetical protein VPNG_03542 [Cytospora leucostoma]